jgi:hypothetical protein
MREVGKRQPMPAEQKRPLFFPGWKVLLPVVGTAAAVIAMVIVLKGGPGPGQGPRVLPGERETVAEVARPFSVAPLAGEDEDLLGKGISLNGGNESAEGEVIGLKPAERAVLTEALSEVFGEEEQWEELDDRELERFEQLLSVRYSLS